MLKRYALSVSLLRSISDISIIALIWLCVFYVRFYSGIFATAKGIPDFERHLVLMFPVILICYLSCLFLGLYKPKRTQSIFVQLLDIFKTSIFSGLFVLAFFYYLQDVPYSRMLLALFVIMLFAGLIFSHILTMVIMQRLRAKGYNVRYYAIIGVSQKAQQLMRDIEQMGWLGLKCVCFIDNSPDLINTELLGIPIYGPVEKLTELVKTKAIDEVYLALSGTEAQKTYPVLKNLQSSGVTIRLLPDWGNLTSISNATAITIGSQILFSAADSPLDGINIILKELFDRLGALIFLVILMLPMMLIAVLIKLTSRGPVFYKQLRMGMDQKKFMIIKFRTMSADAEKENGPQWAKNNDSRRTKIGAWLRHTSLDELPQLFNVIKGHMSLVGPRPERPVFTKQFSEKYTKYMLRHKVKAGMTGWAQIKGCRGNTSLRKRLVYDLYYVKNWSWKLDLWILLKTPLHVLKGENAY
jgi:Undecaprenyl-phosphate glucose phosphotransferase